MRPALVLPDSVTSFNDYYRLTNDYDTVAEALGYSLTIGDAPLPHSREPLHWVASLQQRMIAYRPRVLLTSEMARREFFISPLLLEIATHYEVQLRTEMNIDVSARLRGSLDYYIQGNQQFLIVEAKNADIERGTSQLVAEMVAVDTWTPAETNTLFGAVSIGTIWQFLVLNRRERHFLQDATLYRVPDELPALCSILIGILRLDQMLSG